MMANKTWTDILGGIIFWLRSLGLTWLATGLFFYVLSIGVLTEFWPGSLVVMLRAGLFYPAKTAGVFITSGIAAVFLALMLSAIHGPIAWRTRKLWYGILAVLIPFSTILLGGLANPQNESMTKIVQSLLTMAGNRKALIQQVAFFYQVTGSTRDALAGELSITRQTKSPSATEYFYIGEWSAALHIPRLVTWADGNLLTIALRTADPLKLAYATNRLLEFHSRKWVVHTLGHSRYTKTSSIEVLVNIVQSTKSPTSVVANSEKRENVSVTTLLAAADLAESLHDSSEATSLTSVAFGADPNYVTLSALVNSLEVTHKLHSAAQLVKQYPFSSTWQRWYWLSQIASQNGNCPIASHDAIQALRHVPMNVQSLVPVYTMQQVVEGCR